MSEANGAATPLEIFKQRHGPASDALLDYVQAIARYTRQSADFEAGLSPRAVIALLRAAQAWALMNGHEGVLHRPHGGNTLGRQDVQHLREYLAHARVTPSLYEAGKKE